MAVRPVRRLQRLVRSGWRPGLPVTDSVVQLDGADARLALQTAIIAHTAGPGALGLPGTDVDESEAGWRALRLAISAAHGAPRIALRPWKKPKPGAKPKSAAAAATARLAEVTAATEQLACGAAGVSGWAAQATSAAHPSHHLAVKSVVSALMANPKALLSYNDKPALPAGPAVRRAAADRLPAAGRDAVALMRAGIDSATASTGPPPRAGAAAAGLASAHDAVSAARRTTEAWRRVAVLSRACSIHGMPQDAVSLSRWAALMRNGQASYLQVEAAALAVAELSVKLPGYIGSPPATKRVELNTLRDQAQVDGTPEQADSVESFVPLTDELGQLVRPSRMSRRNWAEMVPVPRRQTSDRAGWVLDLVAAARLALQAEADAEAAASGGAATRTAHLPGRFIALMIRILLPHSVARAGGDIAAWGAAHSRRLVSLWADEVAGPGTSMGLGLSPPDVEAILKSESGGQLFPPATGVTAAQAEALAAAGAGPALEALATVLIVAGRTTDGIGVMRAQVSAAMALAPEEEDEAEGEETTVAAAASSALMPSSALFARVLGTAAARDTAGLHETVEALFTAGRKPTVAVFREVFRAQYAAAQAEENHSIDVLALAEGTAEALGQPVPASVLGWCAFQAARAHRWDQVTAIRAKVDREHPGVWETSLWADRVREISKTGRV
ncbi:hypothetical protein FNF29_05950 [Cafeteria roenbergensis]|uniref:Uncharacterized protein n=2 Tax=Cafeteria roenbergensis TaxID=33653 RepID=A0A5A8C9Q1_CAFRO|nr:hypothetical protein FNF29_05950 [Cafeteria roenbergensis]KAA0166075.1 hypothetical protein FNF28_03243 [Cafeteria roenbergensis]KAA0167158.1 hypothetical protein FNF31_01044 [Cafeteria roenbergensis]|eukprot:KAA0149397.1 hypothetical protein FNF29_05950 [Cafeteria roenbergensis]